MADPLYSNPQPDVAVRHERCESTTHRPLVTVLEGDVRLGSRSVSQRGLEELHQKISEDLFRSADERSQMDMLMAPVIGLQRARTIERALCRWFWVPCIPCIIMEIGDQVWCSYGNGQCSPWLCPMLRFCNFSLYIMVLVPMWGTVRKGVAKMLLVRPVVWYLLVAISGTQSLWLWHMQHVMNWAYVLKVTPIRPEFLPELTYC